MLKSVTLVYYRFCILAFSMFHIFNWNCYIKCMNKYHGSEHWLTTRAWNADYIWSQIVKYRFRIELQRLGLVVRLGSLGCRMRWGSLLQDLSCWLGVRINLGINMAVLGKSGMSNLTKEVGTRPGGKPSSQKYLRRAVLGSLPRVRGL